MNLFITLENQFFSVNERILEVGEAYTPDHELFFITQGKIEVSMGGDTGIYQAGDTLLLPKGNIFRFKKVPEARPSFHALVVLLPPDLLRDFCVHNGYVAHLKTSPSLFQTVYKIPTNPLLNGYADALAVYFTQDIIVNASLLRTKAIEAILVVLSVEKKLADILFDFSGPSKTNLKDFMDNNYRYDLPLESFARISGRSLSAFNRDFREIWGEAPAKWLQKKRLEAACSMLLERKGNASEIFRLVGFKSYAHFLTAFKKQYGRSPSEIYNEQSIKC